MKIHSNLTISFTYTAVIEVGCMQEKWSPMTSYSRSLHITCAPVRNLLLILFLSIVSKLSARKIKHGIDLLLGIFIYGFMEL